MLEEPPTVVETDLMRQERNQSTTESGTAAERIENAGHSSSGERSRPKGYTCGGVALGETDAASNVAKKRCKFTNGTPVWARVTKTTAVVYAST